MLRVDLTTGVSATHEVVAGVLEKKLGATEDRSEFEVEASRGVRLKRDASDADEQLPARLQ